MIEDADGSCRVLEAIEQRGLKRRSSSRDVDTR